MHHYLPWLEKSIFTYHVLWYYKLSYITNKMQPWLQLECAYVYPSQAEENKETLLHLSQPM